MTSIVNFKVYLLNQEDPDKKEIRRFGVDQDVVTNFLYLREKIVNVFPALRGRHFTISWKDEDKDDIVISSDEELSIALSETTEDLVRKLYVFVYSEYPKDYTYPLRGSSDVVHEGIVCNGCDKSIQGFRYKCLQCMDFDLCTNCDAHGIHDDHCMLRLVVPAQWKPHWGRRIAGLMNRSMRKAASVADDDKELKCPLTRSNSCKEDRRDKDLNREKEYNRNKDNNHGGKDKDKQYGKQHKRRCNDNNGVSWTNTLTSYLNDWANVPGECPIIDKASDKTAAASVASAAAGVAGVAAAAAASAASAASAVAGAAADLSGTIPKKNTTDEPTVKIPKTDKTTDEKKKLNDKSKAEKKNPMDPYMELLKMVGENFTPFIETFVPATGGINSHIHKAAADAAAAAVASHFQAQPNPYGFKQDNTKSQDTEKSNNNDPIAVNVVDKPTENTTSMDTDVTEINAVDKSSDNEDWTIIGANANPSSVDVDSGKAIPLPYKSAEEKEAASNGLYPKLPQVEKVEEAKEKIIYHTDKKIQQAIESMMEMGFTNEEGWLTNLLVSKDGDISRALDTLNPVRR